MLGLDPFGPSVTGEGSKTATAEIDTIVGIVFTTTLKCLLTIMVDPLIQPFFSRRKASGHFR